MLSHVCFCINKSSENCPVALSPLCLVIIKGRRALMDNNCQTKFCPSNSQSNKCLLVALNQGHWQGLGTLLSVMTQERGWLACSGWRQGCCQTSCREQAAPQITICSQMPVTVSETLSPVLVFSLIKYYFISDL